VAWLKAVAIGAVLRANAFGLLNAKPAMNEKDSWAAP
jgi:hypothetical protein